MGRKKISSAAGASAAADGKRASRDALPALDKKSKKATDAAPGGDKKTGEWKCSGIMAHHLSVMRKHGLIPGEDSGKVRFPGNEGHPEVMSQPPLDEGVPVEDDEPVDCSNSDALYEDDADEEEDDHQSRKRGRLSEAEQLTGDSHQHEVPEETIPSSATAVSDEPNLQSPFPSAPLTKKAKVTVKPKGRLRIFDVSSSGSSRNLPPLFFAAVVHRHAGRVPINALYPNVHHCHYSLPLDATHLRDEASRRNGHWSYRLYLVFFDSGQGAPPLLFFPAVRLHFAAPSSLPRPAIDSFSSPRSDLLKLGYPRDDCLVLECTLTVLRELPVPSIEPAKEESIAIASPSTKLHQHLGQLLQSGTGGDVTFLVSGESFAAHKAILAARSPVFMAEFFVGDMKEKLSQRVEIEDMEASVFRALLHFIYTDTVLPEELDQQLDATGATMAQHLLAAADRYGLERLKLLCEVKLSGGITVDTAATTLALAEQHNCWQLKAKCMEFIVSTPAILDAVLSTEGYKHLEMSCPSVLAGILRFTRWGMRC
ncbi:uncharacterized protein LOC100841692 [Brachypodium distachyon]|uniref:uncharacterized protein LOC100841692 n=1 Tax=Brachypodium distachyon TaxID=15368 RepID=UPI000D0D19AF|nr:uncharacterized protein LOC100841692 [Brachypodium distachyon]|eukprot:XP_024313276.1 uncharacterized protein LOC100841692 [Brachypodium distachyon]